MSRRRRGPEPARAPHSLDLRDGAAAHDLSPALWRAWCEAASVTLDRVHRRPSPTRALICPTGRKDEDATLAWAAPDDRMRRSHANTSNATEMGAYAVATLAVYAVDGRRVVARTPTESGADLWMSRDDEPPDAQLRLEVSGIAEGAGASGTSELRARLAQKITQLKRGNALEPGVAAVIGFELGRVLVSEVVER